MGHEPGAYSYLALIPPQPPTSTGFLPGEPDLGPTFNAMRNKQRVARRRRLALAELKNRMEANASSVDAAEHNAAMSRLGVILGTSHPGLLYEEACREASLSRLGSR